MSVHSTRDAYRLEHCFSDRLLGRGKRFRLHGFVGGVDHTRWVYVFDYHSALDAGLSYQAALMNNLVCSRPSRVSELNLF